MEILELRSTIIEIKIVLEGFKSKCEHKKKKISEKIYQAGQYLCYTISRRERQNLVARNSGQNFSDLKKDVNLYTQEIYLM